MSTFFCTCVNYKHYSLKFHNIATLQFIHTCTCSKHYSFHTANITFTHSKITAFTQPNYCFHTANITACTQQTLLLSDSKHYSFQTANITAFRQQTLQLSDSKHYSLHIAEHYSFQRAEHNTAFTQKTLQLIQLSHSKYYSFHTHVQQRLQCSNFNIFIVVVSQNRFLCIWWSFFHAHLPSTSRLRLMLLDSTICEELEDPDVSVLVFSLPGSRQWFQGQSSQKYLTPSLT